MCSNGYFGLVYRVDEFGYFGIFGDYALYVPVAVVVVVPGYNSSAVRKIFLRILVFSVRIRIYDCLRQINTG